MSRHASAKLIVTDPLALGLHCFQNNPTTLTGNIECLASFKLERVANFLGDDHLPL